MVSSGDRLLSADEEEAEPVAALLPVRGRGVPLPPVHREMDRQQWKWQRLEQ